MSSRGTFLGTGPSSGVYTPKPTPQQPEDMPIYINDELLDLGGRLNNILEGGAFPPQSQLPKRVKDGMMIYFTQPIKGSDISSAGVWLYKKSRWWKIIDDPSAVSQNLSVYKKFPKGSTRPPKPPTNKYLEADLNGWSYVPAANDPENDQWLSVATWAVTDPDNPKVDWSEPIMFNTEGTAGQPGADGYSIEFRYIASTFKPSIKNNLALDPETKEGVPYVANVPGVTHPDENYVWMIQAYIRNGAIDQPWSDPVRFSTPDTTKANSCYSVAKNNYINFDAAASGLPGVGWSYAVPVNIPTGYNLWRSDRLDWTDGTPQVPWSTPYKANGQVGAKQESRYTASTNKPTLVNNKSRTPVGTNGEVFELALPNTSHPEKSFIWVTTAVINRLDEVELTWSEPAKYATPDATNTARAYATGGLNSYPTFVNTNPGLPGKDWSKDFPGALTEGQYIWETSRLEWTDGTGQTSWTTPVRIMGYDGIDGDSFETRYRASTTLPSIATGDRFPANWNLNVPQVSHPNSSYVWVSTCQINSKDELVVSWSVPAKYATPDSTTFRYAYGVGTDTNYPTFNPNAAGLPGTGWAYEPQKVNRGQRVWVTARYQWNDSTAVTSWITPSLFSGSDGQHGNPGNDGFTLVEVYKNATSKPAEIPDAERAYPPSGWNKKQETPPMGQVTWTSKNYVRGTVETATTTLYNYSGVVQLSGSPGQDGNPGSNGSNGVNGTTFYTWIRYADTSTGGGMSSSPVGKKYVGFAYNQTNPTPSTNSFDYAWYQLEGTQGIPGKPGVDGVTTYTWLKYADNASGGGMSDSPTGKVYLGLAFNKTVQQESTNPADYQWSKILGDQGIPGTPGDDGVTLYTWVKYADNASGGGMADTPVGKLYLGLAYNKLDQNESNDPKLYTWALIKGLDGSNGSNGTDGKPGINGNPGLDGSPGAGFYRLSMTNFTVWPSQATVDSAFRSEFGRDSEQDDILTIYDSVVITRAETRRKDKIGSWVSAELLVHGDMILRGTIVADRIAAGTISTDKLAAGCITAEKIAAGNITSDKIQANVSLNAPVITGVQINGGQLNIGSGAFTVGTNGALYANSANITGSINATSGTFRGTITGSRIEASSIGIGGRFSVDSNGYMTCTGASIGGTLQSVGGIFTGTLQGVNGSFTGTIQAGSVVSGSVISGGSINVPASNPRFNVDVNGNMICNNATINGSLIQYGGIEGSEIHVPTRANYKFRVDSAGNMTATSARIIGDISGSTGTFSGTVQADNIIGDIYNSYAVNVSGFINSLSFSRNTGSAYNIGQTRLMSVTLKASSKARRVNISNLRIGTDMPGANNSSVYARSFVLQIYSAGRLVRTQTIGGGSSDVQVASISSTGSSFGGSKPFKDLELPANATDFTFYVTLTGVNHRGSTNPSNFRIFGTAVVQSAEDGGRSFVEINILQEASTGGISFQP